MRDLLASAIFNSPPSAPGIRVIESARGASLQACRGTNFLLAFRQCPEDGGLALSGKRSGRDESVQKLANRSVALCCL
jgi:hypothetical protein